jgi:hypothetical protein
MDLIGICGMGLAAGIDKWCGIYSRVFRSVCIGRMVGYMIDSYSETMLHFYPSDKRILYKANSIRGRQGIEDIRELTKAVNESFKNDALEGKSVPKNEVTVSELSELMSAASMLSADSPVGSTGRNGAGVVKEITIYDFTPDPEQDIETSYIQKEDTSRMLMFAARLPLLHRKILKLKGIKI